MDEKTLKAISMIAAAPEATIKDIQDALLKGVSCGAVIVPDMTALGFGKVDALQASLIATLAKNKTNPPLSESESQVLRENISPFFESMAVDIEADFERMGSNMVGLGFPDPRTIQENWRVIARMVGADPGGFVEDIYESALAYRATNKSELVDGLAPDGLTLRWGGELFPFGSTAARVVKLLFDAFENGFPYLHEEYLKTEGETYTDMRRLVKDNGLESIVIRETRPDGTIVKGKWGLIDPRKINSVIQ